MNKRIRIAWIFSLISIACIIFFQSLWLVYLFRQNRKTYTEDVNRVFVNVMDGVLDVYSYTRPPVNLGFMSVGVDVVKEKVIIHRKDSVRVIGYEKSIGAMRATQMAIYDLWIESGQIEFAKIDTMVRSSALLPDGGQEYRLTLIDISTGEVLASTGEMKRGVRCHTDAYRIGLESNHGVYATFHYPISTFFKQMFFLMLASLMLFIVLLVSLIYQIRTIQIQRKVSQIREEFVYSMVHELKAPLAYVRNALLLLAGPGGEKEKGEAGRPMLLENMRGRVEMLGNMLEKMLTEGRWSGKLLVSNDAISLAGLSARLTEQIGMHFGAADRLHFINESGLEQVTADRLHFSNMLYNLIENAFKYGGQGVEVTVCFRYVQGRFEVEVRDTGPGISPKYHARIFESFYRVQEVADQGIVGFGVGLSYVKHVAQAHGGSVRVYSQEGHGAQFVVNIAVSYKKEKS